MGNPDRQVRDSLMRNQLVMISKGPLKGLKGTVLFANETHAEVHIHSRNIKAMFERDLLQSAQVGTFVRANDSLPMQLSFDEAAEREYVNEDARAMAEPDKTPVREFGDGMQSPVV